VPLLDVTCEVLAAVRRAKTEAKVSQRAEVSRLTVTAPAATLDLFATSVSDLLDAGSVKDLRLVPHDGPLTIDVVLAAES
jgi:valyl-tRNA synthetase